ncbi:hypothetical protein PVAP13_9NG419884 [Panicum virgatum]|uniref:Peptidyl-prolyl cis-trans isomerase n=1 Tax=Panicum virgatum TaxID=38727 RepID=A0A8T0MQA0_PANVG|nr:hypothetical protein PVAP13_9NG419884 [Panicum virgatum]
MAPTRSNPTNPTVFLDLNIGGERVGRVVIELFTDKSAPFHRVVPGFMCQGGDITGSNGTSGESAIGGDGRYFPNGGLGAVRHDTPGVVSMANAGPNTNGSQFFIEFGRGWMVATSRSAASWRGWTSCAPSRRPVP